MEFSAIQHNMDKSFCFALEKGRFLFRIRVKKNDMAGVILHYEDKYLSMRGLDTKKQAEMEAAASDGLFDYYEAAVRMDVICLRYFFELTDRQGQTAYYGNYEFYPDKIDNIDLMFDCPQNLREEERFIVPAWAKNKVVYQIFPSRFAASEPVSREVWYQAPIGHKADLKGNLRGIIDRMGHLHELGVDILYMTPIFQSDSSHKYDTADYYRIDESFGTQADLKELVDRAHALGMKVILDAVFNHTSTKFFAFADILEKQERSPYRDWYYIDSFPASWEWGKKPNYKSFGYFGGMPKLNLRNPETERYFIDVGRYWIEQCGIDGWRLDVGDEIGHRFWKHFREGVKAVNPEALIVGEVWHCAGDFLEGDEWDSVMNYPFYYSVLDLVAFEKITPSRFLENLGRQRGTLHTQAVPLLWNLVGSHDTPRILFQCGENKDKLKMAAALQLLLPGMPMIYYGDEYGMTGGQDPDCRRGMCWEEERQDADVFAWYQRLIRIRKAHPCMTEGRLVRQSAEDEAGLLLITRESERERITLVFHAKEGEAELPAYKGMYDLVGECAFEGRIGPWKAVVLQQTGGHMD